MTRPIKIRKVDSLIVKSLCDQTLTDEGDLSVWLKHGHYWGAFDTDKNLLAFGGLVRSVRFYDTVYLHAAGVAESARGHRLQRRLIRVRLRWAKANGYRWAITDTVPYNPASACSLIACGFKPYWPKKQWKLEGACYWRRKL